MTKYVQLVMGPAGSGKTTYCEVMRQHFENIGRSVHIINLDPAAENLKYPCTIDICELITVNDVMSLTECGPNGGLVQCIEYLVEELDWLREKIGDFEEDYLIIDCPGQIELYTHIPIMKKIADFFYKELNYKVVCLYLLDASFITDSSKFISGTLTCLSAMLHFEMPHINVFTKMDLLGKKAESMEMDKFFEANTQVILNDLHDSLPERFHHLNEAIAQLIEEWSLVNFIPLNINDEDSISLLLSHIDNATQYGEYEEPKEPFDGYGNDDDDL